jgi:hypothetical protein
MKIALPILVVAVLAVLAVNILMLQQLHNPPTRWEYSAFKFNAEELYSQNRNAIVNILVSSTGTGDGFKCNWTTNLVTSADAALNHIGYYGWDLAWSDGTNFIVKRPQHDFQNGAFIISTEKRALKNE